MKWSTVVNCTIVGLCMVVPSIYAIFTQPNGSAARQLAGLGMAFGMCLIVMPVAYKTMK